MLRRVLLLSASVCLGLAGTRGTAQIAPEQVWSLWQGFAERGGYRMIADAERRDGDSLVLEGVSVRMRSDRASLDIPLGRIVMRGRGDGSVAVTMPTEFPIRLSVSEPGRAPVDVAFRLEQTGQTTIVSGTPEAPAHAIGADTVTLSLAGVPDRAAGFPQELTVELSSVQGTTTIGRSEPMALRYELGAGRMEASVSATAPSGGGAFRMAFGADDLQSRFDGALPVGMTPDLALTAALQAGLRGSSGLSTGPAEFSLDIADRQGTIAVAGTLTGTSAETAIDRQGLSYRIGTEGISVTTTGSRIPFPALTVTAGAYELGLTMPLLRTTAPADFGFVMRLVDLVLPAGLWALVDPTSNLPRDPASLVLEARGKATLFRDLVDPGARPGAAPGTVDELTIDALQLKAAGADLTGTGAFRFDNSDIQTFPGFPRPVGAAELKLVGGNTLLERLAAMGLIPPEQLMGIRMGLALFARPAEGPDTLTSTIEITPEAQIIANGQRLR